MGKSIWEEDVKIPAFERLQGDHHTEVLIIGGGICGVLCAYFLQQAGVNCLLAEADTIGKGVTCNTTAKITSQHGLVYDRMLRKRGRELTHLYLAANENALEQYRKLADSIPCDFEEKDAYVYSLNRRDLIEKEVDAVNKLGFPAIFTEELLLPFPVAGAIGFSRQAQFHPGKFLAEIAKGLNIYEHTFIRELEANRARYERGIISFDQVVVATHFPFVNRRGNYFLKLYQHRSYVAALENAQDVQGMYLDADSWGLSFRNYQNRLLLGGGSHRTGRKGGGWQELLDVAAQYYPQANVGYLWAAQDCMSLDQIPYIGPYSPNTPGWYMASGFNKWGMTSSMAAAMILKDLLQGKKSPWAEVFDPARSIWNGQLFCNMGSALAGMLTPTWRRCPHMGCALKWNPQEHTWDCACHGSRFDTDGRRIDNPSQKDRRS